MATVSYSNVTSTTVTCTVTGLEYPFNSNYYGGVSVVDYDNGHPITSFFWYDYSDYIPAPSSSQWTSKNYTFTIDNLSPSTTYTLYIYIDFNGTYYRVGNFTITTRTITTVPTLPTTRPIFDDGYTDHRGDTYLRIQWGSSTGATYYEVEYKDWQSTQRTYVYGQVYTTLTGLKTGTSHYCRVRGCNSYGSSAWTNWSDTMTTLPKEATLTATSTTSNSITIQVSGLSWNWTSVKVECYQGTVIKNTLYAYSNNESVTFNNLLKNTTYTFKPTTLFDINNTTLVNVGNSITASTQTIARPSNFYWGLTLSAEDLNDFCDRINEFRTYKGFSTVSFPNFYSGQQLTATAVNQITNAINTMIATGIPTKSSGSTLSKTEVQTWATKLNSIT